MRPYGSRPGIPTPAGVADPVVLRILVAMREAIERLTDEVEKLKLEVHAAPPKPPLPTGVSNLKDARGDD